MPLSRKPLNQEVIAIRGASSGIGPATARAAAAAPLRPSIAAIVPTLNEERCIEQSVRALFATKCVAEICVVDGGSTDETVAKARGAGARVVSADRGRGSQMACGARTCSADVLWFIHADTIPPPDAGASIVRALADDGVIGGHFRPRFDGETRAARFLTWLYPHLSLLGLKYGDASLFVRTGAYVAAGGFRDHPIFEDLDLLRRLRRHGRMVQLTDHVVTSSRRFQGRSFGRTFAAWTTLQLFYWIGVSPKRLGRWYPVMREPGLGGRRQHAR